MTTGERLVNISTLTTGTALEHFMNISGGGSVEYVYIPSDEKQGEVYVLTEIIGTLEQNQEIKAEIPILDPVIGVLEDDAVQGELEENNELKGEKECQ